MIFLILVSPVCAQSITIDGVNPSSITKIKNEEFSTDVTYTITGSFSSCSIEVDENTLPSGWSVSNNPKQINCSSGTSSAPKITGGTKDSAEIRFWVKGSGATSKQDDETFYATVSEGAILDASLISDSSLVVAQGESYRVQLNVKNNGDTNSEGAAASISYPSGYDGPSAINLKEAGQDSGVIRDGKTVYTSFDFDANNPTSGTLNITVNAANSQEEDTVSIELSYSPTEGVGGDGGVPGGIPGKIKNATRKPKLVPGVGLRNNTKLQGAIQKVLGKGKLSQKAINNLLRLSKSIISDLSFRRDFKIEDGKTKLTGKMKYKGKKKAKNLIIYDIIPKTFAKHSDEITLITDAQVEVVEPDPSYLLKYPEVSPGEELRWTYETSGEKDASLINETQTEVYTESLEELKCPICPECLEWSECINGTKTRTCYKCSAETNYTCEAWEEERLCGPSLLPVFVFLLIIIALPLVVFWYHKQR